MFKKKEKEERYKKNTKRGKIKGRFYE